MYTAKVPQPKIDLSLPEAQRWSEVIRAERKTARRFARAAMADVAAPGFLVRAAGVVFKQLYQWSGGRYVAEIEAWSEALGLTPGEATLANCQYELFHARDRLLGCTAGIAKVSGNLVHVRSMDWPITGLGDATRIFRFVAGRHEFVSVGMVGFVGVLSGMVPGAYSVTINWAPPVSRPRFEFGPAFLLREVLETCETFEDAVSVLRFTPLSTSVFFTVCGRKNGEACVVERTGTESAVRKMTGPVLVQGNHHVARKFRDNNDVIAGDPKKEDESLLEDSQQRFAALEAAMLELGPKSTLDDAAACLDVEPVCNADSYQQMLFVPRTGELKVWRWV